MTNEDLTFLFKEYNRKLVNVARLRVGSKHAEDVTQDVWVRILKYSKNLDITHPFPYLLEVLRTAILEKYRVEMTTKRGHQRQHLSLEHTYNGTEVRNRSDYSLADILTDEITNEDRYIACETFHQIDLLGEAYAKPMMMACYGFTYEEIAKEVGITSGYVGHFISMGRKMIREKEAQEEERWAA